MVGLELKVPPVAVFLIAGAGMWAVDRYAGIGAVEIPARKFVAACVTAAGIAVGIAGIAAFRRQGTTVHPMHPEKASLVVSSGVYRFTRNPMYLGLALLLAGWTVYLGNIASALLLPVFVMYMSRFQIVPEERALRERFGDDFAAYRASVRRWL